MCRASSLKLKFMTTVLNDVLLFLSCRSDYLQIVCTHLFFVKIKSENGPRVVPRVTNLASVRPLHIISCCVDLSNSVTKNNLVMRVLQCFPISCLFVFFCLCENKLRINTVFFPLRL